MTQDEIIRMVREAGFWTEKQPVWEKHEEWIGTGQELERFAALVAAHEREACAKVCDKYATGGDGSRYDMGRLDASTSCAAAIRARGEA